MQYRFTRHAWLNTAHEGRPALVTNGTDGQRIASEIRSRIISGKYPEGSQIPSTPNLAKEFGVSKTPVRDAVKELQAEGTLEGRPGKGVYVRAVPAAAEKLDLEALSKRVDELKQHVEDRIGQFEADLIEVYSKNGLTYQDRRAQHG
jgi:GntR family transcriptional regulator